MQAQEGFGEALIVCPPLPKQFPAPWSGGLHLEQTPPSKTRNYGALQAQQLPDLERRSAVAGQEVHVRLRAAQNSAFTIVSCKARGSAKV
jgi:hypothetical protein